MNQIARRPAASVRAADAEASLPALLDRVERGEQIVIMRDGKPVARLVSETDASNEREFDRGAAKAAVEGLRALRAKFAARGLNLTDQEIREFRDEGRKY